MKNLSNHLIFAIVAVFLSTGTGCKKDKPEPKPPVTPPSQPGDSTSGKKVYVLNEGLFNTGKGTVSLYYPATGYLIEDYYGRQNDGAALGDVVYSMIRHNNEFFIVVNNSGKIIVTDLDFKKKGEIGGLASPRYILPIVGDVAYVSDFKSGTIAVINFSSRTVTKQIVLPGFTERMILLGDNVYATNVFRKNLYKIDPVLHNVIDSIEVGPGGEGIVADKNGKLWVLASGDYMTSTPGKLSCIDPATWSVEKSFSFDASAYPTELRLSPGNDTLYYLDNGVRRMSIDATVLPATSFIPSGSMNLYALDVEPATGHLFVSDAIDYTQRSAVLVYNKSGQVLSNVKAGIMSTGFYFE